MYISCFIIFPWSLIWIHPCLIWIQHPLMMMIIIVIIIILLVVQLLSLLLLPSSSSSFFCVSECFLTGVWLFNTDFVFLLKPLSVHGHQTVQPFFFFLLFIYLFILSTFTLFILSSFLFFLFLFFYVQLPCVGWEVTK